MDQNLTAEEQIKLDSKLRLVTASFALQRRRDSLAAARGAVTMAKGLALQAHCKTLLGRDDFERLLETALSTTAPTTADELLAVFQKAVMMNPAVPMADVGNELLAAEPRPVLSAMGACSVTQSVPINGTDADLALRRGAESDRLAECEAAAMTCLRAWLELVVCSSPSEAWDAGAQLFGSDHYRRISTTATLLSRFNDHVRL